MPDLPHLLNGGGFLLALVVLFVWWLAVTNKESDR